MAEGDRETPYIGPHERIVLQTLYTGTLLTIIVATAVLTFTHDLDKTTLATIYGSIVGHLGSVIGFRMGNRQHG